MKDPIKLTPGIGFHLQPSGSWRPEKIPVDVIKNAEFSGYLTIQGYQCSVFETPDLDQWGQKSVAEPIESEQGQVAMISRLASRVAFKYTVASDETIAASIADEILNELNKHLPDTHKLFPKGKVHEAVHTGVTFEAGSKELDRADVAISIMFIVTYDPKLKSISPSGSERKDWAEKGGSGLSKTKVSFLLEMGFFKRESGMGVQNKVAIDTGEFIVIDQYENLSCTFEHPNDAASEITSAINDVVEQQPKPKAMSKKQKVRLRS